MFLTAPSFVGAVGTIDAAVAEVESRKACAIAAGQTLLFALAVLQQRLRRLNIYEKPLRFQITIRYTVTILPTESGIARP